MNEKPEAMRLAQRLGELANLEANELAECMDYAATELRRLHAENEAMRKDAERYRWLTEDHPNRETRDQVEQVAYGIRIRTKSYTDACIDAAMKGQP